MKKITLLLLLSFIAPSMFSQEVIVNPIYDGTFGGATYSQTFNFPTGAGVESWAGFANNNTRIYPLSYPNGGQVSFKATVATNAEIKFVFEADVFPNVNPSVSTVNVPLLASNPANTVYTVAIPANATNTYRSALMYVVTRNVAVSLSEIKLIKFDTNGTTQLRVDLPVYDGTFGGATYSQTFNFPTGADSWAGFANNNVAIYPLSFPSGFNKVSFKATVPSNAEVKFVFEANPFPNVNPSVSTANVPLLASNPANTLYEVEIPANATNTYNSALMYVITRDVPVSLSEIKIHTNATPPPAGPTVAAPTPPARAAADVKSIFSNAYTPIAANLNYAGADGQPSNNNTFNTSWCAATTSLVQVAGNDTHKVTGLGCEGVSFLDARFDATSFTHFHIDMWTPTATLDKSFNIKFSNWNGGTQETNALEYSMTNANVLTNPNPGTWYTFDIPLSSFTCVGPTVNPCPSRTDFTQFIITSNLGTVYYDNLYLHKNTTMSSDSFEVSKVKLYPNPTSNVLNIESLGTIQTISVYNVLGQEVINKALNSTSTSLDVSSLNSGIYVVKTVVDGVTSSTKFIKQ
jgi:hypothetical protein